MANLLHSGQTPDDGIHVVHAYVFADSTAMDNLNDVYKGTLTLVAADVGKAAFRQSDDTFWLLSNHSPVTWIASSFSGVHGDLTGLSNDDHTIYILADGSRAFGGNVDAGSNKVVNVANPTVGADAVNLTYFNTNSATGRNVTAQSGDYNAVGADIILADTSLGNMTITLPLANTTTNNFIDIKKVSDDGFRILVEAQAAELIDGVASKTLDGQYNSITLTSDGSDWYLI